MIIYLMIIICKPLIIFGSYVTGQFYYANMATEYDISQRISRNELNINSIHKGINVFHMRV